MQTHQKGNLFFTRIAILMLILSICFLAGCRAVTVTTADAMVGQPQTYKAHILFWGLIGDTVNTGSTGIVRVEAVDGVGDYIVGILTCGLYFPRTVSIWSKQHVEMAK